MDFHFKNSDCAKNFGRNGILGGMINDSSYDNLVIVKLDFEVFQKLFEAEVESLGAMAKEACVIYLEIKEVRRIWRDFKQNNRSKKSRKQPITKKINSPFIHLLLRFLIHKIL